MSQQFPGIYSLQQQQQRQQQQQQQQQRLAAAAAAVTKWMHPYCSIDALQMASLYTAALTEPAVMLQASCKTCAAQRISSSSCAHCEEQQRDMKCLVSDSVQKAAAHASNLLQHPCTSAVLRQ
jgi:hypothetical protein